MLYYNKAISGPQPPDITVDGNTVEQVENFVYLQAARVLRRRQSTRHNATLCSRVISQSCHLYNEPRATGTSLPTRVRVYWTIVLPVLAYACETWTLSAADARRQK